MNGGLNVQVLMFWGMLPIPFSFLFTSWAMATKYRLPLTEGKVALICIISMVAFVVASFKVASSLRHPIAFTLLFMAILVPISLMQVRNKSVYTVEEARELVAAQHKEDANEGAQP